jgi:alkylation response protein AidB-like acyl-CoA dehydrogenase
VTAGAASLLGEQETRQAIREFCVRFPSQYWREADREGRYPDEFVRELTQSGWLACMIPEEYGGGGQGLAQASWILEEINRAGGNSAACHAQMYTLGPILRHGSDEQKLTYLPRLASGELRLQSFGVTEPDAGSDTTRISTFAAPAPGGGYLVNGRKVFTSRFQHSDLLLLLARTTPLAEVRKKTDGLSLFLVDLREAGDQIAATPIETMVNHETNELVISDLELPVTSLIGEEGQGFRYVLSGLNAERVLVASEAIGDGHFFLDRATEYARQRVVFGRPIGMNQGVQFPLARTYLSLAAATLMRDAAARGFDAGEDVGAQPNMAKYLASEAGWEAANAAMSTFGGYGFATEYDIERKFRESRLYVIAPVSNNLILGFVGEHLLGLPRSY